MSYENFIPTVWSAEVQRELERKCVAAMLSNRDFEGEIKDVGNKVKINGVGRPTIGTYVKNSTVITPENLNDQSTQLEITESDYFCFEIDDIDKKQTKGNLMNAEMSEASAGLAEATDDFLYQLAYTGCATDNIIDCASLTSATVFSKVLSGIQKLWENNVPDSTDISIEVSPGMLAKLILAKILKGNPNDTTIANGFQGNFLNHKVYLANGVYNDGTYDYCVVRTKKALAFADQMTKIEAFRPQSAFSDAVKGLHLYGGKVVRPKELVVLKFSAGAESSI